ncbi:hypothetical protein PYCCODRAFT_1471224 [Trametes coccinea BRFM310]|uniref:Uncharacterized protein n=1 Tax=Trametes coccinea (strain BRFM310) TaxID=1353009 RepID=A0A1Y2IAK5_TRAC3|nr:hypothetical protein PYCCODRAFT_1471224 [Trametes coccinea BRFM310]
MSHDIRALTRSASSSSEYRDALMLIETLRHRVKELETSNIELAATARAMENAYRLLLTTKTTDVPSDPAAPGSSSASRLGTADLSDVSSLDDDQSPAYDADKHGDLKFWNKSSWDPYMPRHHLSEYSLSDGVPRFLENLDGTVMDRKEYEDLRSVIKRAFQELYDHNQAPETWSRRNFKAQSFVRMQVYRHYPVLRNCARHWKVDALCTRMYPDFTRDRSTRGSAAPPSRAKRELEGEATVLARPVKRAKTAAAVGPLIPTPPAVSVSAPVVMPSAEPTPTNQHSASTSQPSPSPLPGSPSLPNNAAAWPRPSSPDTAASADVGSAFSAPGNSSAVMEATQSAREAAHCPLETLAHTISPSASAAPAAILIDDPLAAFRSHEGPELPDLVAQITTAPISKTSKPSGSAPDANTSASTKKANKMRLTKNKTARNIYAHAYFKEHAGLSAQEFDKVYKGLDSAILQEYHAMHVFAQDRPELETPDDVLEAFARLPSAERQEYMARIGSANSNKKGKGRARA